MSSDQKRVKRSYMNIRIESNLDKDHKGPWHKQNVSSQLISVNIDKVINKNSRNRTNDSMSSHGEKKVNTLRGTGFPQKISARKKASENEQQLAPLIERSQNLSPLDFEMKDVYSNQITNKNDLVPNHPSTENFRVLPLQIENY